MLQILGQQHDRTGFQGALHDQRIPIRLVAVLDWRSGRRLGFLFDTEEVAFDAAEHGARIPAMVEHSHQRAAVILLIALSSVVDMRIM